MRGMIDRQCNALGSRGLVGRSIGTAGPEVHRGDAGVYEGRIVLKAE